MRKNVARFVRNCQDSRRNWTLRHSPYEVLCLLQIPQQPWKDIAMDFVTGLPRCKGFNAIWVVVDRLTKMRHLVPCTKTTSAEDVATMFLQNIWKLHRLPDTIVSD